MFPEIEEMKSWMTVAFLLVSFFLSAQQPKDPFYFVKEISTFELSGREIEIEIWVKQKPGSDSSQVRIYAIQLGKGKEDFISQTLTYAEKEDGPWTRYYTRFRVDQLARKIWFYCGIKGTGTYYFDQLQVLVKESTEVMRILEDESDDFERKQILKTFIYPHELSKQVRFGTSKKTKISGKQALQIKISAPL